jgi:hypothetical protein
MKALFCEPIKQMTMRNIFILAILSLGLYSCNKEYTCECVAVNSADSASNTTFQINTVKEKSARAKCMDYENTLMVTINKDLTCTLK